MSKVPLPKLFLKFSGWFLLHVLLLDNVTYADNDIEDITELTLSPNKAKQICQFLSKGDTSKSKPPYGVTHPFYCSRYIECSIIKNGEDDNGNEIHAVEKICPKCDPGVNKISCPYGYKNWHEESQSCVRPATQDKCRQMELNTQNLWGDRGMAATVCNDTEIGSVIINAHPTSCSSYINCYRDPVFTGDTWAIVGSCPACDESNKVKCGPDGYLHYQPPSTDSEGVCHLPADMTDKCDPATLPQQPEAPQLSLPKSSETIVEVEGNFPTINQTPYATQFCAGTEKLPQRHAIPGVCHKYFYCWANLFDRDGDMRPASQVHHYEFTCPTCWERESEGAACPPQPTTSTSTNQTGYLQFDFTAQDCIIPTQGHCGPDVNATKTSTPDQPGVGQVAEPEEKLNSPEAFEEAKEFCKTTDQVPARVPSTTKCHTYYACWATLYDKDGNQRPLDKVMHIKFKCDKIGDGNHYWTFDNTEQTCIAPVGGRVCLRNGEWADGVEEIKEDLATTFCKKEGKDGNFAHPNDTSSCTRYIQCWFGQSLFKEMECLPCRKKGKGCPHGKMFFNPKIGECQQTPKGTSCETVPGPRGVNTTIGTPPPLPPTPMATEGAPPTPMATEGAPPPSLEMVSVVSKGTPPPPTTETPPASQPVTNKNPNDDTRKQAGLMLSSTAPPPGTKNPTDDTLKQAELMLSTTALPPVTKNPTDDTLKQAGLMLSSTAPPPVTKNPTNDKLNQVGLMSNTTAPPPVTKNSAEDKPKQVGLMYSSTTPSTIEPPLEEQPVDPSHAALEKPKACSPRKFIQRGYCKHFFSCSRKTRREKKRECSGRLYWNPDAKTMHGGRCEFLKNLGNFTLRQYQQDPGCPLHIAYFRTESPNLDCSSSYYYHHPKRTHGKELRLKCPDGLLWSKERKTCVLCHEAFKKDAVTPCCGKDYGNFIGNDAAE